jgi:hypothetical protein
MLNVFILMLTNFYSHALELLGIIRSIKYNFSCLDTVDILYIALIRSKPKHASVVWKNLLQLVNKLESTRRSLANLCCYRFIQSTSRMFSFNYNYYNFKTFHLGRQYLMLYSSQCYREKLNCYSVTDTVAFRVRPT